MVAGNARRSFNRALGMRAETPELRGEGVPITSVTGTSFCGNTGGETAKFLSACKAVLTHFTGVKCENVEREYRKYACSTFSYHILILVPNVSEVRQSAA